MASKEAGTLTPMTDTSIFICRFLKLPDLVRPGIMTDLYLEILILRYGPQGQYHGVDTGDYYTSIKDMEL